MRAYLLFLVGVISIEGQARDLMNDFSECRRIKTEALCDLESDYAVERINCYKKIIENHKRCERNVTLRIRKEKDATDLRVKNEKDKIKKEAWDIIEKKYEDEAMEIIGESERKKIDDIELSKKFRAYNSVLSRQVIKPRETLSLRVSKHIKSAHELNGLIEKSLVEFEKKTVIFLEENEKILKDVERIIKNFESYFSHYQSEIHRISQFEDNKAHYLKLMEESKNLSYEIYEMHRALVSLKSQLESKTLEVKNLSEEHKGIRRGEHLVTELFKARKELERLTGEEKDSLQVKVDFLTKYCLIEYKNNPQVCQEY